jgi:hypothetical protein
MFMNKRILFSLFFIGATLFFAQQVHARIWRVNNNSNFNGTTLFGSNEGGTAAYPVFPQVNNVVAWSAVVDGDTVHVEGSNILYNFATVTKRLVVIGPGYFLNENPNTSNDVLPATIAGIVFNGGASGSQLIGMNVVTSGNINFRIFLDVDDLTVRRCRIERTIELGTSVTDITVEDNFFSKTEVSTVFQTNGNVTYVYPNNVYFNNNICQKTLIWAGSLLQCNNNVFDLPANSNAIQITTGTFQNNILKSINATVNINNNTNLNVFYNIGTAASQFGTADNNIVVPDMSALFVDPAGNTTDGDYQLEPGSPGSGNGSDGTDRGPFGGAAVTNRYAMSGLAPIPVIYNISTTGVTDATGLPVTIKARTIK